MSLTELVEKSTTWLGWSALSLAGITLIAFLVRWDQRFRFVGITGFTIVLTASSWAFLGSYTPGLKIEGALYAPIVFDNGEDLVVAQADPDFPNEAIAPSLEQLAGNLKGGGRTGEIVNVRLRRIEAAGEGISRPVILGEVRRDIKNEVTLPVKLEFTLEPDEEVNLTAKPEITLQTEEEILSPS